MAFFKKTFTVVVGPMRIIWQCVCVQCVSLGLSQDPSPRTTSNIRFTMEQENVRLKQHMQHLHKSTIYI